MGATPRKGELSILQKQSATPVKIKIRSCKKRSGRPSLNTALVICALDCILVFFFLFPRKSGRADEADEETSPCPYCDFALTDSELTCPKCRNNVPYCIATVSRGEFYE